MPAPALASPSPLTVLVLAWDAATPAVRTLIETAPGLVPASLGPVLVLVPPAAELAAAPAPEVAPVAAPTELVAPTAVPPAAAISTQAAANTNQLAAPPSSAALPAALAAWEAAPDPAAFPPRPVPAVRVTQLAYTVPSSPSQLAGLAPTQFPAAPYLGATPPAVSPTARHAAEAEAPLATTPVQANHPPAAPAADVAPPTGSVPAASLPTASEAYHSEAYLTDEALAPDLEADLLPGLAITQEVPSLAPAQPVGATTVFSAADQATADQPDLSDLLSPDAVALTEPAAPAVTSGEEATFSEADEPSTVVVPTATDGSLAVPLPADLVSKAEPAAIASPPLRPAAANYLAPDLNTQVIRYARFAVPTALAEGPFGTIYAPAWPTWLAALELRQRTDCPLVLHLPALAAGRESADTAAGWPAEIQRQALRQADVVLTETYALARRLRRELGLAGTVVRVVPAADGGAIARALRRARRREAAR